MIAPFTSFWREPRPGHTDGLALAINAREEVAGETSNPLDGVRHAVVWQQAKLVDGECVAPPRPARPRRRR
jgi:hypothetical protein